MNINIIVAYNTRRRKQQKETLQIIFWSYRCQNTTHIPTRQFHIFTGKETDKTSSSSHGQKEFTSFWLLRFGRVLTSSYPFSSTHCNTQSLVLCLLINFDCCCCYFAADMLSNLLRWLLATATSSFSSSLIIVFAFCCCFYIIIIILTIPEPVFPIHSSILKAKKTTWCSFLVVARFACCCRGFILLFLLLLLLLLLLVLISPLWIQVYYTHNNFMYIHYYFCENVLIKPVPISAL